MSLGEEDDSARGDWPAESVFGTRQEDPPGSDGVDSYWEVLEVMDFVTRYIRNFILQACREHSLQAFNTQWLQPIIQVKFLRESVCTKLLDNF